jgi:hypothetical protein
VILDDASVQQRGTAPGLATVSGRGRSAAEVAAELLDVLADDPRVVECDLGGMAAGGTAPAGAFRRVDNYLAHWPGPVVLVHAPDPSLRTGLRSVASTDRMFICSSWDAAGGEHEVLPDAQRHRLRLSPVATAPREARRFVTRTLLDWQVPGLVGPASQVVSELVNSAATEQVTTMDLTVSKVDQRVRIAVRDDGPAPSEHHEDVPTAALNRSELQLVQSFTDGWDVIPAPSGGKTVCAVLDARRAHPDDTGPHGWTLHRSHRRRSVVPSLLQRSHASRLGRGLGNVVSRRPRASRPDPEPT